MQAPYAMRTTDVELPALIEERRRNTVVETAMVVECSARKCSVFTTFA